MKEQLANNIVLSIGAHLSVVALFCFAALLSNGERVPLGSSFVMVELAGDGDGSGGGAQVVTTKTTSPALIGTQEQILRKHGDVIPAVVGGDPVISTNSPSATSVTSGIGNGEGNTSGSATGSSGRAGGDPRLSKIRSKIERAKYYPVEARSQKITGRPKVEFEITQTGDIANARIISPSGSPILDNAALETLKRAEPLPYFPESIKLAIVFDLSE